MAIFNSYLYVYQAGYLCDDQIWIFCDVCSIPFGESLQWACKFHEIPIKDVRRSHIWVYNSSCDHGTSWHTCVCTATTANWETSKTSYFSQTNKRVYLHQSGYPQIYLQITKWPAHLCPLCVWKWCDPKAWISCNQWSRIKVETLGRSDMKWLWK